MRDVEMNQNRRAFDRPLPSGSPSVGIWPIGLILSRSRKASLVSHDALDHAIRRASPSLSAASIAADPSLSCRTAYTCIPLFLQARIRDRARDRIRAGSLALATGP